MSLSSDRGSALADTRVLSVSSYLEWGAIFGGAAVAAATSSIMTAFGSALGLSLISPVPGHSVPPLALAAIAALWGLWISVSCFAAGGYIAGRMRRPVPDATPHEGDVRDAAHGLVVWAVGALILGLVTAATVSGTAKTAVEGGAALGAAGAASMNQTVDPFASALDDLTRTTNQAGPLDSSTRQELSRIFVRALDNGKLSDSDRTYVAAKVAARSGISQADADKRVDDAMATLNQDKAKAIQTADTARKIGIVSAFLTAALLLVGAAAAWGGARVGGRHRDEELDLSHFVRRR